MMKQTSVNTDRRHFLTKAMPACALTCLGTTHLFAAAGKQTTGTAQETHHKFDSELDETLTFRELFRRQYHNTIVMGKLLKQELGDEKAIDLIKRLSDKGSLERGRRQAQRLGENSLQAFVRQFKEPHTYEYTMTKEIVEDTETAFELKVTECLWADVFRERDAGDIGFAWMCYGDYGWPQGFNPKLRMVRDKTLMQGHDCCNHRYILDV